MKYLLLGNGFDIQFGGSEYSNKAIIERAILNAKIADWEDHGYTPECADVIIKLWIFSAQIVDGCADSLIGIPQIKKQLDRFKHTYIGSRRDEIGKIGIEDYLFIANIVSLLQHVDNPMHYDFLSSLKKCFLDAIYNKGKIEEIHNNYPHKLKDFMLQFESIFTTNYGQSLEVFLKREIFYLHGAFHICNDLYRKETFLGDLNTQNANDTVPRHQHLRSSAILSDNGESKDFEIHAPKYTNSAITKLADSWKNNFTIHDGIESWDTGIPLLFKKSIHKVIEAPESTLHENNAFDNFKTMDGELHIIGLSPFNDNHIFDAINENSLLRKIVFYYYQDAECGRMKKTLFKKDIECRSAKKLWNNIENNQD